MVRLHVKLDNNHKTLMLLLEPTVRTAQENNADIRGLKRDRFWVAGILMGFGVCLARVCSKIFT